MTENAPTETPQGELERRLFGSYSSSECGGCARPYGAMLCGARCECGGVIRFVPLSERRARTSALIADFIQSQGQPKEGSE